jgi:hypothetical protein
MNKQLFLLCLVSLVLFSCHRIPSEIDPKLSYQIEDRFIQNLPSAFPALNPIEQKEDWGKEFLMGTKFAHDLDFYRAITAFKRASYFLTTHQIQEKIRIDYAVLLCYYFGQKYEDVVDTFEKSPLTTTNKENFKPFHDLLLILYDSYKKIKEEKKSQNILKVLILTYPESKKKLLLSQALTEARVEDIKDLAKGSNDEKEIHSLVGSYEKGKKSIAGAQFLNAIIPGAGYLYIGQKKTALTAMLVNGAFIYATYEFFHKGFIGAGIIFASLEFGWYAGGIYGVGLEAKVYNERLYEKKINPFMNKNGYFPICHLEYAF